MASLQQATASHGRLQRAVAHLDAPWQASPSPPSSRSTVLNSIDAILDVDTAPALPFILYLSSNLVHIHDLSIYACAMPSCQSISYAMLSISCAMEMCYSILWFVSLVCLCVVRCRLWTEPLSQSRDCTSLKRLGHGFIPPWL